MMVTDSAVQDVAIGDISSNYLVFLSGINYDHLQIQLHHSHIIVDIMK